MIGLDTNILVRYFAEDDPAQLSAAREIIENRLSEESPGYVSIPGVVELVWVLERSYGQTNAEIATAIERMLQAENFVVESEQEVFAAKVALQEGRGSFADALNAALSLAAGCSAVLTFDRKALRLPGYKLA